MRAGSDIDWYPERGELRLGNRIFPATAAGTRGEIRLHGPGGSVLRPLTFGERNIAAMYAAGSPEPTPRLARSIREAALVTAGSEPVAADHEMLETAVALFLAGAATEAPSFDAASFLLGRAGGWSLTDIASAVATEVDRLAIALASHETLTPAEDGWHRIVLMDDVTDATSDDDLDTLIVVLAEQLLSRYESEPMADAVPDADTWESEPLAHQAGAWRQSTTAPNRSADLDPRTSGLADAPVPTDRGAGTVQRPPAVVTSARWQVLEPPLSAADLTMPTQHTTRAPAMRPAAEQIIDRFEPFKHQSALEPAQPARSPVPAGSAIADPPPTGAAPSIRSTPNPRPDDRPVSMPILADMVTRDRGLQNAAAPGRRFPGRADWIPPHVATVAVPGSKRSPFGSLGAAARIPQPAFAPPEPTTAPQSARLPTSIPTLTALSVWADELAHLLDEEADLRGLDP